MKSDKASDIAFVLGLDSLAPNIYGGSIYKRRYTLEYMPFLDAFEMRTGFSASDSTISEDFFAACDRHFTPLGLSIQRDAATIYSRIDLAHFNHEKIDDFLAKLSALCSKHQIGDACFNCGSQDASIAYRSIDAISAYLCDSCNANLKNELRSTLEAKNTSFENSKYPKTSMLNVKPRSLCVRDVVFFVLIVCILMINSTLFFLDKLTIPLSLISLGLLLLIIYKRRH